ncbi:unnamed protein product [Mycena citricolor]|uniref:Mitochondrial import inner membrane translocase subunit TIM54 n=1 Tax=Mycena citricolor TaxID=2018698 RepID=A0AAD2GWM7_9AGAR|nr:unnamed protein product [Mycena citricolor]
MNGESSSTSASGIRTVLKYTGIPPSWLDKRPKLPSRNWLIFLSVTSSIVGLYVYDRKQCEVIRQEYVDRVKHLADETKSSLAYPRKVVVYGAKWPGDEDHDQTLKYFRKYVKPILVAAAVDYEMIGGKRQGDIADRVAEDIKARRRLEAGIDTEPEVNKQLPAYRTPVQARQDALEGGIMLIGRPTFKEFMAGLKRGWTEPMAKVDPDEALANDFAEDGTFDDDFDGDVAVGLEENSTPPPAERVLKPPPFPSFSEPENAPFASLPDVPPVPPLIVVPFVDRLGFFNIPMMIWDWFNLRHDVRNGAQAAYRLIQGNTRPFNAPPAETVRFADITSVSEGATSDLDFDRASESHLKSSLAKIPAETEKNREKYYSELKTKLATARALARGTREPTKEEVSNPPPTEVELRDERLKKEKRWRGDVRGWLVVAPSTPVAWDERFRGLLKVYADKDEE